MPGSILTSSWPGTIGKPRKCRRPEQEEASQRQSPTCRARAARRRPKLSLMIAAAGTPDLEQALVQDCPRCHQDQAAAAGRV